MDRSRLSSPLLFLLRTGVPFAVCASAAEVEAEFPFAAGTDSTGRAQAVSDAAGRVLIESPEFPRGLWVDLVGEAGQALAGIQVEYTGRRDGLVALRCVDPSGLRQETLLWTRATGDGLRLALRPGEPANLPPGLTAIDWRIEPSVEWLSESNWLIGWAAVAAFLRNYSGSWDGWFTVRLGESSIAVDMNQTGAIETLVPQLQGTHVPGIDALAEGPAFAVLGYDGGLLGRGVILETATSGLLEDGRLEEAVLEALGQSEEARVTLQEAVSLTRLEASGRGIRSLAGIEHFAGLRALDLNDNQIVDVSPLASVTNLDWLSLNHNGIVDVSPLASLTWLARLFLRNNEIVDASPLASLELEWLDLGGNQIRDIGSFMDTFVRGARLSLEGNPLSDHAINEQIPALEARGVTVTY